METLKGENIGDSNYVKRKKLTAFTLAEGATHVDSLPAKCSGFTLAEVLITLGIIGVVAALTIPGLINNYKAHRLHSQFLKSYSTVQQVFRQMEADDVSLDPSTYNGRTSPFFRTFMRYLTAAYDCGAHASGGNKKILPCYSYSYDTVSTNAVPYKTYNGKNEVSGKLL